MTGTFYSHVVIEHFNLNIGSSILFVSIMLSLPFSIYYSRQRHFGARPREQKIRWRFRNLTDSDIRLGLIYLQIQNMYLNAK